jgi:hypothetical protein
MRLNCYLPGRYGDLIVVRILAVAWVGVATVAISAFGKRIGSLPTGPTLQQGLVTASIEPSFQT